MMQAVMLHWCLWDHGTPAAPPSLPAPPSCATESPHKKRQPGERRAPARALVVVFQRGKQIWSKGASLQAERDVVRVLLGGQAG